MMRIRVNVDVLISSGAAFIASAACFGAIALALVSQYAFDMQPCPWCILQRAIFVLLGLNFLALAVSRRKTTQRILASSGIILALCGVASALWQHFQAAASSSCNLTLADKIISKWTHLSDILPFVFEAHSSCSDAQVNLLGIPYAFWSLALFAAMAGFLVVSFSKKRLDHFPDIEFKKRTSKLR